tara:strand:+ start:276 stop:656 length:381 start_codon:yes stop_codon:yes gene_type:complete
MKNLMIFTLASLMSISAFAGLSKQERQEFVQCSSAEDLINRYNLHSYFDISQWEELKVLYEAEMSPLDSKKMQRKIKKAIHEQNVPWDKAIVELKKNGIREEHIAPAMVIGILKTASAKKIMYSCF